MGPAAAGYPQRIGARGGWAGMCWSGTLHRRALCSKGTQAAHQREQSWASPCIPEGETTLPTQPACLGRLRAGQAACRGLGCACDYTFTSVRLRGAHQRCLHIIFRKRYHRTIGMDAGGASVTLHRCPRGLVTLIYSETSRTRSHPPCCRSTQSIWTNSGSGGKEWRGDAKEASIPK